VTRFLRALAVLGVVLITLFGVARLWLDASLPPLGGRERVAGLADSVIVLRDSLAIPHVIAVRDSDFFVALGYLHARDRMWQMDLLRHTAEGRLSELFGERAVDLDLDLRELEMGRIAAARIDKLGRESLGAARAYARGVNAWLAVGRRALEFRLLGHTPEPWRLEHSLEIGVLQAWDLRNTGDELELAEVAARLGPERALELLPSSTPVPLSAIASSLVPLSLPGGGERWAVPHPSFASNSWVIAGHRTASGKPILANDTHLTLRAPSIWYLVGAHAPGYHVVGATIPGAPVVVLGHTTRVAWGFTNAMVDDVDYVIEELSADSARYRTARGWSAVEAVVETVTVKGAESVVRTRRRTAHGPLVSSGPRLDSNRALALRWTAQDPGSDEVGALLGFARASDWRTFRTAVALFRTPEQNVVYADSSGHIAYWLAGRVPVREGGVVGATPAPGWLDVRHWMRFLEPAELPHFLDPAKGWIATGNNRVVDATYPHFLSRHYDLGYRAERIEEMLREDTSATIASVSRHQMDVVDGFARANRSLLVKSVRDFGRVDLADRLRGWDGVMAADAVEPAVYWSWYRELQRLTFEDESPDYRPASALHQWMQRGESRWFDDVRTPEHETLDTMARRAISQALTGRRAVAWADVHQTVMDHPLAAIPVLGRLLGFRIGPLRKGGSNYTVNNSSSSRRRSPFTSDYGPSLRHVVDFGDPDGASGFILPTGESGHPLSRHYRDQTGPWLRGELWVLPLNVRRVIAVDTLVLTP